MPEDAQRLAAIGEAAAAVLRHTPYHSARAEVVAAAVKLPGGGKSRGRSAVWLYNEVKSRRVLVGLAAFHAWEAFRAGRARDVDADARPQTVIEARENLVRAMTKVIEFHRSESTLMTQVGHGIGDIATTEKRGEGQVPATPVWPTDSPWGRVADDAWHSRLGVYADFLVPILRAATCVVTLVVEQEVRRGARLLSDLAFHTWLADPEGPVGPTADGLAALWFERHLVSTAGPWVRDLEGAERTYFATKRRGTDPRAEVATQSALIRVLLNAGTMYRRCVTEGERVVAALTTLNGWGGERAGTSSRTGTSAERETSALPRGTTEGDAAEEARTDHEALCDAASRHALAALRYGDLDAARRSWELSREVAERGLGGDGSRIARAESNLAVVMCMAGRPLTALQQINRVKETRALLARHSNGTSGWRRLTITHNDQVLVAYRAGLTVEAVQLATALFADRRAHGAAESINVAEARLTLGRALLAAGHPVEARGLVEDAYHYLRRRFVSTGIRLQETVVSLTSIALALEDPESAVPRIEDAVAHTEWFAQNVSFRLAYQARRLRALVQTRLGDATKALRSLYDDYDRLLRILQSTGPDPLLLDYKHTIVDSLLRIGDLSSAAIELDLAIRQARALEEDLPRRARTLLLRARLAIAKGDDESARDARQDFGNLINLGLDRTHPLVLTALYEEAERLTDPGEQNAALSAILDRRPLAHGRPALGDGHPLLLAARDLAAGIEARRQGTNDEDLPWDVSEDHR